MLQMKYLFSVFIIFVTIASASWVEAVPFFSPNHSGNQTVGCGIFFGTSADSGKFTCDTALAFTVELQPDSMVIDDIYFWNVQNLGGGVRPRRRQLRTNGNQ